MFKRMAAAGALLAFGLVLSPGWAQGTKGPSGMHTVAPADCRGELSAVYIKVGWITRQLDKMDQLSQHVSPDAQAKLNDFSAKMRGELADLKARADAFKSANEKDPAKLCQGVQAVSAALTKMVKQVTDGEKMVGKAFDDVKDKICDKSDNAIKRTDAKLYKAAKLARQTDNGEEAFPELRTAWELQEDAKQAHVEGKCVVALRLTLKARSLVNESVEDALDAEERADVAKKFVEQTDNLLSKAQARVDEAKCPQSAEWLSTAQGLQQNAKDALDANKPVVAFRYSKMARKFLGLLAKCERKVSNVEERIDNIGDKLEKAQSLVAASGDQKAAKLLETGAAHLDKARDLHQNGQDPAASAQLDVAAKLIAKAVDIANGPDTKGDVRLKAEIKKTSVIVAKAQKVAATDELKEKAAAAKALVEQAKGKTGSPVECLKLLDKATDIAFAVIAQSRKAQEKTSDETGEDSAE